MMINIPKIVHSIYPKEVIWRVKTKEQMVYLTFDDGPEPDVTPKVLDILEKYNAKATFFMVGENAERYPAIVNDVIQRGHGLGNHSYNHLKGWHTKDKDYFDNINKAAKHIPSKLFRPPHGQLFPRQAKYLVNEYTVVMWTILSGDYNRKLSPDKCTANVIENLKKGAVIVFHDSVKARKNMLPALENTLKELKRLKIKTGIL